jgi:hypothetical protein
VRLREPKRRRKCDNHKSTALRIEESQRIRRIHCSALRKEYKQRINAMPNISGLGWLLKSCPKCSGDLYYDVELDREYIHCLQCGYEGDASGMTLTARAD